MTQTAAIIRPVRIAVQLQPQHASYARIRDRVRELEDLGVDILFNWDHFFPLSGDPDGLHFEAWTELGSWAELTSQIEFGTLVNCNSYRTPDLQADMARTLDHISGGRFVFGTGAGWFERDYREYGYEFGTPGSRLADLAAALPRIRLRWSRLNPPPVRDIPILIGGAGERKTLRIVAEHADIWHSFADPETLDRKLEVLRRWCDEVGRDPAEIELSVDPRPKELRVGDELRERGVTLFTIALSGERYESGLDRVREWLRWRDEQNG